MTAKETEANADRIILTVIETSLPVDNQRARYFKYEQSLALARQADGC